MEDGTYQRHVFKANIRKPTAAEETAKAASIPIPPPSGDGLGGFVVYDVHYPLPTGRQLPEQGFRAAIGSPQWA
jgi:hypothetical protein